MEIWEHIHAILFIREIIAKVKALHRPMVHWLKCWNDVVAVMIQEYASRNDKFRGLFFFFLLDQLKVWERF